MLWRGFRAYYSFNNRNLVILLLISSLFISISGVESSNGESTQDPNPSNAIENQSKSKPTPIRSLSELSQSSQYEITQTSTSFDLNDYESLKGTNLHFIGWLDYNNDSINDMIFIVEFNGTSTPYDLVIFDGITYQLMNTYTDIADFTYEYSYKSYFIPNVVENLSDLMISFKSRTSNACNWVFVGISSGNSNNIVEDCRTHQSVVDFDGDGDLEILVSANNGDFWIYTIDENMVLEDTGNILAFTGISGDFENLNIANFTNDNIPDFALTQISPDESTIQLYLVDGQTYSLVSNITIGNGINTILTLNIDNTGADEIIYISAITGELFAINATGHSLPYRNFQSGYSYDTTKIIPDMNKDDIQDILVIKESSLLLIISGIDGDLLLISPYIGAIENCIRANSEVSIGQISDSSYFVLQANELELKISTFTENDKFESFAYVDWGTNLSPTELEINSNQYLIKNKSIDFNVNLDQDGLSAIDEFFFSTDDLLIDSDEDGLSDIEETQLRLNPNSKDSDHDGIPDKYEVINSMNYFADDSDDDLDEDGLTNLEEYQEGTDIRNRDTDGDGLPDGWEIRYGFHANGTTNDRFNDKSSDDDGLTAEEEYKAGTNPYMADTDGDEIPDKWELDNGLDPLVKQNLTDFDRDGLSALEEYQYDPKLDPLNYDTDEDGLNDGYEVSNGLNATYSDAGEDKDGDFLSNGLEYKLGTNPNGKFDRYISILLILIITSSFVTFVFTYRKLTAEARSTGFKNYFHMRAAKKQGFSTLHDF
ncbi:MAG: hypothetical protein ACW99Q_04315, partial [Candidatus Kariarchaeaceae archaeon]